MTTAVIRPRQYEIVTPAGTFGPFNTSQELIDAINSLDLGEMPEPEGAADPEWYVRRVGAPGL